MDTLSEKLSILAIIVSVLSLGSSPHPAVLVICYVIHELGHIVLSYFVGAKMRKFKIGALHLSLSYDTSSLSYKREILVQLGGITFNALTAMIVLALPILSGDVYDFFIIASLSLALMNLYPISILDGGGILKNLLLMHFSQGTAERISKIISFVAAILLWFVSVYLQLLFASNFSLFFISVLLLVELCFTY